MATLVAQMVKNLPAIQETQGLISGSGRYPGEVLGHPLQYFCLENSMDKGVHEVAESDRTEQLNTFTSLAVCSHAPSSLKKQASMKEVVHITRNNRDPLGNYVDHKQETEVSV